MIRACDASFDYGGRSILDALNLTISCERPIAIMGTSGCGKTTLLRLLAGLEQPTSGRFSIEGIERAGRDLTRRFYSFQDFDAFPWQNARQNVDFVLRHTPGGDAPSAGAILEGVGLGAHGEKFPRELSGGMRKRLALGRAIASGAGLLLLDEPFSSLDVSAKAELHELLLDLCQERGVNALIVTHDIDEAVLLSAEVLVCWGPPLRVAERVLIELPYPRSEASREQPEFEHAVVEVLKAFRRVREEEPVQRAKV